MKRVPAGALLRQGTQLLLVGPKGLDRFPKASLVRRLQESEALQVWGLRIPQTSSAHTLRHLA